MNAMNVINSKYEYLNPTGPNNVYNKMFQRQNMG